MNRRKWRVLIAYPAKPRKRKGKRCDGVSAAAAFNATLPSWVLSLLGSRVLSRPEPELMGWTVVLGQTLTSK